MVSASVCFLQHVADQSGVANLKKIQEFEARLVASKATVAQQSEETPTFKDQLIHETQFQAQFHHGAEPQAAAITHTLMLVINCKDDIELSSKFDKHANHVSIDAGSNYKGEPHNMMMMLPFICSCRNKK